MPCSLWFWTMAYSTTGLCNMQVIYVFQQLRLSTSYKCYHRYNPFDELFCGSLVETVQLLAEIQVEKLLQRRVKISRLYYTYNIILLHRPRYGYRLSPCHIWWQVGTPLTRYECKSKISVRLSAPSLRLVIYSNKFIAKYSLLIVHVIALVTIKYYST